MMERGAGGQEYRMNHPGPCSANRLGRASLACSYGLLPGRSCCRSFPRRPFLCVKFVSRTLFKPTHSVNVDQPVALWTRPRERDKHRRKAERKNRGETQRALSGSRPFISDDTARLLRAATYSPPRIAAATSPPRRSKLLRSHGRAQRTRLETRGVRSRRQRLDIVHRHHHRHLGVYPGTRKVAQASIVTGRTIATNHLPLQNSSPQRRRNAVRFQTPMPRRAAQPRPRRQRPIAAGGGAQHGVSACHP